MADLASVFLEGRARGRFTDEDLVGGTVLSAAGLVIGLEAWRAE